MIRQLDTEVFLEQSQGHLILDVRSEGEYNYGHIVGATNLPLFNNEERKTIGTLYKQQGRENAILTGLDIVGPKMSGFIRFAKERSTSNKVFIHCWRGGMRSGSMAWLLDTYGFEVAVLKGGYKAFRHHTLAIIGKQFKYILLGGKTGSGKTGILKVLQQAGEQVVDLEALAQHKGSAFGALGQAAQPSTEHFENLLAEELKKLDSNKPVWLEDESKNIGKVFLDLSLWNNMLQAPLLVIEIPLEIRLKKLVEEYGNYPTEALEVSLTAIKRRLGPEQWKNAADALHNGDMEQVAAATLYYYDKAYNKCIAMRTNRNIVYLPFTESETGTIVPALLKEANKLYGN